MKQHRYKCLFTCLLTHLLTHLLKGLAQESRLPPTTKYSEGNSYNILNHEILDETKFKIAMKSMFQAANRQTSSAILAKQKQEGELRVDINEQRKMNRVSYKRWEQEIDRGYNFINTTNELHVPKAARPATVWSKVHTSNPPQNSIPTSNQDESRSSNKGMPPLNHLLTYLLTYFLSMQR